MCLHTISTVLLTLTLSICFVENSSIRMSFTIYNNTETCRSQCKKGICINSSEDKNDEWYCNCVNGYYGADCKEHPCHQMPCKNGGKCVAESVDGRYYTQEALTRMKKMPSLVYQMIASEYKSNTVLGYKCICDEKYVGERCESKAVCADQCNGNEDADVDVVTCSGVGKCIQDGENVQCQCEAGHIGERCRSYAACTPSPCHFGFACLPLYGDVSKFTTNYTCACQGNKNCAQYDRNECATQTDCHMHANCGNNLGSYSCNCNEGFEGDGKTCVDIDECQTSLCSKNARCNNTLGSFSCECNKGYQGDGGSCEDINECESDYLNDCHENATCVNTIGSFKCHCKDGYQGDGRSCEDLNECESNDLNNSDEKTTCFNTIGSFERVCKDGYEGNGVSCEDVNECKSDSLNDCHENATCVNAIGSFKCHCKDGFEGDGRSCEDVNECESNDLNNTTEKTTCVNTLGSFEHHCKDGYEGDGSSCEDINECKANNLNDCHEKATCFNTIGSYECSCKDGYEGSGIECTDIDECSKKLDECNKRNAKCVNTEGSYKCQSQNEKDFYIQYKALSDVRDTPIIHNVRNNKSRGMTICAYYKFSQFPNRSPRSLFHYIIDQRLKGFQVIFYSKPQKIRVTIIEESFDVPYPTNENKRWTHLCAVYDRGNVTIWKNGFVIKKHTIIELRGTDFPASNLGSLVLGQDSSDYALPYGILDSSRAFQGSITQFYIWEKILNRTEIQNAYRKIPTTEKTVLAWDQWRTMTHGKTIHARFFSKKGRFF